MRKVISGLFVFVMSLLISATAVAGDDISKHRDCIHCGMDRKAYGYSRMLIEYENGTVGVCSLRCGVVEMDAGKSRKVKSLLVADRETRRLVAAEKAIWVTGGRKPGVMTQHPKWAFETRASAEAFIKKYGGKLVSWEEALASAREELRMGIRF